MNTITTTLTFVTYLMMFTYYGRKIYEDWKRTKRKKTSEQDSDMPKAEESKEDEKY